MKKCDRAVCPVCNKDVAVTWPGQTISRHASAIKQLKGVICSASGQTLDSYKGERSGHGSRDTESTSGTD